MSEQLHEHAGCQLDRDLPREHGESLLLIGAEAGALRGQVDTTGCDQRTGCAPHWALQDVTRAHDVPHTGLYRM